MKPVYEIGSPPPRVSGEVLELLSQCEIATIGHWRQWGFCHRSIRPLIGGRRIVGRAVTVAIPSSCSVMLHYAVDQIEPGDILMVDRLGDDRFACWGGGITVSVKAAGGIAGVVDGPCTDLEEMQVSDLPVWSRGLSPITTRQYDLGGRLNVPVCVGGVVVSPGDYVICDDTGVLVLPPEQAEAEARRAIAMQDQVNQAQDMIVAGGKLSEMFGARARIDAALAINRE